MNVRLESGPRGRSAGLLNVVLAISLLVVAAVPLAGQAGNRALADSGLFISRAAPPRIALTTARRDTSRMLAPIAPELMKGGKKARQDDMMPRARSIDYSGPRFGVTYLPKAAVDSLHNHKIDVSATITQFGWQFEREIHVSPDGPRVLNEWIFLAGGLESGAFLPSMTWLVGARDRGGNEIGVGPNVSVAGVGMAAAAGLTVHNGAINFPMNIAVAKSKTGARVSFLTGFTIH